MELLIDASGRGAFHASSRLYIPVEQCKNLLRAQRQNSLFWRWCVAEAEGGKNYTSAEADCSPLHAH